LSTIVAGALWGTSFPAIKIGLAFADPFVLVFLRMLLATVLVILISYATNNLSVTFAKERLVWYLGLLNGFAYLIQYVGMGYTTASKSSLLVNLSCCLGRSSELVGFKRKLFKEKNNGNLVRARWNFPYNH
jgi:drug/metabolite transporter (DMT)-like permease